MTLGPNETQPHIVQRFPRAIREIRHAWIPMADGARLAARIWLPVDAEELPVPAILEYLPYRKNDSTAPRDALRHPYFAGHGYAAVRVDMRGSGDADGILYDEYLRQEQDDGLEVIEWLAAQPWCSGAVGIFGKSWGGFNGLQIAARRPPHLKAVISLCSTDDRYADDVHYRGGCLFASNMLWWASIMLAYNARPPDPQIVGERWRAQWLERLGETPPFVEEWLRHPRRDAYWQHGSVCEDYADVACPVYAVGGWADAYTDPVLRLLAGLPGPRKGLIGPWAHEFPEVALPGPAIGFLQECLRWWDQWLKGIGTGIMDEPLLRVWLQEGLPPSSFYTERPGRWVLEPSWPSPGIDEQRYWLSGASLARSPAAGAEPISCTSPQDHGLYAGVWCPFGEPGDMASDQRYEDGLARCFDSEPLAEPVDLLGFPEVTLDLSADRPLALVAARLCDISPDGASTLVSWGMLNLTHRDSHEHPAPVEPGERYRVTVRLNAVGYTLRAGHHWRLALAPTFWPHAWPSPEPVTLTVYGGPETHLSLPVRPRRAGDPIPAPFAPPETAPALARETLRPESRRRTIQRDLVSGVVELIDVSDDGLRRLLPDGITFGAVSTDTYRIAPDDPLSASVRCQRDITLGRDEWQTRITTVSSMTADAERFLVDNEVAAYEGEIEVFRRSWRASIPRDLV